MDVIETETPGTAPFISTTIKLMFDDYAKDLPLAYCFILIDPALRDAADHADFAACLANYESANDLSPGQYRRIQWQHENLLPAHRPYLLSLDLEKPADKQLLQESVELALLDWDVESRLRGQGHRICGWLFSENNATTLARHLGFQAVQRRENGKHMLLRYFDPSVMPALWEIGDAVRQANLLGPVGRWLTLDQARIKTFMTSQSLETEPVALNYNDVEWTEIENIGPLNRALTQWEADSGKNPDDKMIGGTRNALTRARNYGFHDSDDLALFAIHSLNVHPRFDKHPAIQTLINNRAVGSYYGEVIEKLQESHWQQVKTDMSASLTDHER